MKNSILSRLLVALLLVGSVLVTGCFEENITEYDGPPLVEFKPTSATVADPGTYNLNVQLIGPHQSQPIEIGFVVVDSLTTAEAGVHYSLPTSSNTFTIPANSSFGELPVQVLAADSPGVLALRLTGNDQTGVEPATNYATFMLSIQP